MVSEGARSSLGRSLDRLKTTISNSFKRSTHHSKPTHPYEHIAGNAKKAVSSHFAGRRAEKSGKNDDIAFFNQDSDPLPLEKDSEMSDKANVRRNSSRFRAKTRPAETLHSSTPSKRAHHISPQDRHLADNYLDGPIPNCYSYYHPEGRLSYYPRGRWYDKFVEEFGPFLGHKRVESICKEYRDRHGPDFLEIGLKSYLNSVEETKRFRQRCYHILSHNYHSSNCTSNYYKSNSNINSNSSSSGNYGNGGNGDGFVNEGREWEEERAGEDAADEFNTPAPRHTLTSHPLSPPKTRTQPFNSTSSNANKDTEDCRLEDESELDSFINQYEYLNSDKFSPTNFNASKGNSSKDNTTNPSTNSTVLSYNEKLRLLEKIGINDDYIAMRICTKFDRPTHSPIPLPNTAGSDNPNYPGGMNLEDFNLFFKDNLKSQLDLNECLSQEIIHISNIHTPVKQTTTTTGGEEGLFKRIVKSIEKNKDSSPFNLLNLSY